MKYKLMCYLLYSGFRNKLTLSDPSFIVLAVAQSFRFCACKGNCKEVNVTLIVFCEIGTILDKCYDQYQLVVNAVRFTCYSTCDNSKLFQV